MPGVARPSKQVIAILAIAGGSCAGGPVSLLTIRPYGRHRLNRRPSPQPVPVRDPTPTPAPTPSSPGAVAIAQPVDQRHANQGRTGTQGLGQRHEERPWVNGLGMKFVPVTGTQVLFSVWDTRVQDFEMFVNNTGYDVTEGMYSLNKDG